VIRLLALVAVLALPTLAQPAPAPASGSAYDLQSPLPTPTRLIGWPAPESTPAIAEALAAHGFVLLAFVGTHSRYSAEQSRELGALAEPGADHPKVLLVDVADPESAKAVREYRVSGVPSLVLVGPTGIVTRVWESVTTADQVLAALAEARTAPPPTRATLGPEQLPVTPDVVTPDAPPTAPTTSTDVAKTPDVTVTADSSASPDYGPGCLVDGLLPSDPAFRPWVSSHVGALPIALRFDFPAPRTLKGVEILARTGRPELFSKRWPKDVELLLVRAGQTTPELLAPLTIDAEGAPARVDLAEEGITAIVVRVLSLQGPGRICEMAEVRIW
jgi:hypothetical protein